VTRFIAVSVKTFVLCLGASFGMMLALNETHTKWLEQAKHCGQIDLNYVWWRVPLYLLCSAVRERLAAYTCAETCGGCGISYLCTRPMHDTKVVPSAASLCSAMRAERTRAVQVPCPALLARVGRAACGVRGAVRAPVVLREAPCQGQHGLRYLEHGRRDGRSSDCVLPVLHRGEHLPQALPDTPASHQDDRRGQLLRPHVLLVQQAAGRVHELPGHRATIPGGIGNPYLITLSMRECSLSHKRTQTHTHTCAFIATRRMCVFAKTSSRSRWIGVKSSARACVWLIPPSGQVAMHKVSKKMRTHGEALSDLSQPVRKTP
jgi:hypothetical protein